MATGNAFVTGQAVLFRRGPSRDWEKGEYMRAGGPEHTGWHWVRDDTGWRDRHFVPRRRLKAVT
jgi:hypothetical protein